ncbi:hypothetical protein IWX47DRAFT_870193 [Phyllosticta citricarpa]|uniref:Uncharacterized protein n=1 Tax=Phyllosticta citricarpa TaxID=55181 RepID=A0ABR1MJ71_9PEZI
MIVGRSHFRMRAKGHQACRRVARDWSPSTLWGARVKSNFDRGCSPFRSAHAGEDVMPDIVELGWSLTAGGSTFTMHTLANGFWLWTDLLQRRDMLRTMGFCNSQYVDVERLLSRVHYSKTTLIGPATANISCGRLLSQPMKAIRQQCQTSLQPNPACRNLAHGTLCPSPNLVAGEAVHPSINNHAPHTCVFPSPPLPSPPLSPPQTHPSAPDPTCQLRPPSPSGNAPALPTLRRIPIGQTLPPLFPSTPPHTQPHYTAPLVYAGSSSIRSERRPAFSRQVPRCLFFRGVRTWYEMLERAKAKTDRQTGLDWVRLPRETAAFPCDGQHSIGRLHRLAPSERCLDVCALRDLDGRCVCDGC